MSQSSSASQSGPVSFGTDEASRPQNWALIAVVVVVGLLGAVWLYRRK